MLIESSTLKIFIYCCLSIYAKLLALYCTALYRIPLYCSVFWAPSFTISIFLLVLTAYLSFYLPLSLSLFFPPSFFVLVFISLTLTLAISFSFFLSHPFLLYVHVHLSHPFLLYVHVHLSHSPPSLRFLS